MNEISSWVPEKSHSVFNYLLIRLFLRKMNALVFVSESLMLDRELMPAAIRYLYLYLLVFKDLRVLEEKQARTLCKFLTEVLNDFLGAFDSENLDPQFAFFLFKVGDLLKFKAREKVSMMGRLVDTFPII